MIENIIIGQNSLITKYISKYIKNTNFLFKIYIQPIKSMEKLIKSMEKPIKSMEKPIKSMG